MCKKFFAMVAVLFTTCVVSAATNDYDALTIEKLDGTTCTLSLEGLGCTFADNMLVAHNFTETQTFAVADLAKMYFSKGTQGIEAPVVATEPADVEVFSVVGSYLGSYPSVNEAHSALDAGIYILRSAGVTTKIVKQ